MQRGEIWTLRDDNYASKARPVVVIQGNAGDVFDSLILCLLTSYDSSNIETRIRVAPIPMNGLKKQSYVMPDKIVTVARSELGEFVGFLSDEQMHEINRQIAKLLVITKDDLI